jgi:hypothetical protein
MPAPQEQQGLLQKCLEYGGSKAESINIPHLHDCNALTNNESFLPSSAAIDRHGHAMILIATDSNLTYDGVRLGARHVFARNALNCDRFACSTAVVETQRQSCCNFVAIKEF